MKNNRKSIEIKQYKELIEAEKIELFKFIKSFRNPLSPDSLEKMDHYYMAAGFNFGASHYTAWQEGRLVSSLGYVDKEVPEKKEAYMASVYCTKGHEETLRSLYGRALGMSSYKEDFTIKLGFFHTMEQPKEVFLEKGFQEEYHLLEMDFDLKGEWNANPEKFEQDLKYEIVGLENLDIFLKIHNDAFIKSPNGAVMDRQDGLNGIMEKKEMPWQLLILKENQVPVAIGILNIQGKLGTIEGLAVDPAFEGKGRGRKALWTIMKIMAEHGIEKTLLQVMDNNKRAYELYLKTGFQVTNIHSDWFTLEIGKTLGNVEGHGDGASLEAFMDRDGKVTHLPMKKEVRQRVLAYLADKFKAGENYSEKQVNEILSEWHTFNDFFLLRRELVDYKYLHRTRDGSKYWK